MDIFGNMNKAFKIALSLYEEKEILGSKANPKVMEMFKSLGHSWVEDDSVPWCAAYVGYCLEKSGMKSTRKLNARSYLKYGTATTKPEVGDLVVLWRGKKRGWQGHVGFYIKEDSDGIWILGGNQSNQVSIVEYPKSRLLGYRKFDTIKSDVKTATTDELISELIDRLKNNRI